MKVAITVKGPGNDPQVDPAFGRAPGFLIVDEETGATEYLDNAQNLNAAQGAGIQAAQTVARAGVRVLLTGNCGPKAFQALEAAGVTVYDGVNGAAMEALEQLRNGALKPAAGPNVQGHWR